MNDNKDKIMELLRQYWETKKGTAPYPTAIDIDPQEIEQIWPDCALIEVTSENFTYEYAGENFSEAYYEELEGKEISEDELYPESPGAIEKLFEAMQFCLPLEYEGAFINKNNDDVKFRKLLLPLGNNGKVTHILCAMRWRLF